MKLGNCFESSCKAFMDIRHEQPDLIKLMSDIYLVHGLVTGTAGKVQGTQYSHGWVEMQMAHGEEFVFDSETGYLVTKSSYYLLGKIQEPARYNMKEVLTNLCDFEHYGPWEDRFMKTEGISYESA